jgi:adenylate kinase family enzyme
MADRVLVYGVTGSGKTTLARKIAEKTGLPWHSVDDLTWEPGWVGVPLAEQRRCIAAICAGDRWILDSGYSSWIDIVLARVELIVALDYPRWRSLARLARRSLARAIDRRTICNGNTETFRLMLSSDSILVWHFRSFARKRGRMRAWAADPAGPAIIRLTSPAASRRWLASLDRASVVIR